MLTSAFSSTHRLSYFVFLLWGRVPAFDAPFPTRRSSDLGELGAGFVGVFDGAVHSVAEPELAGEFGFSYGVDRSEEHTSELQSRVDLVCRLLLEKKKEENTSELKSREDHVCTLRSAKIKD